MAAPAVTGTGTMGNMVVQEMEWTLPKTAKTATAKGIAGKGVAGKGVAGKGIAAKGVAAKGAAAQNMAQVKLAAVPGLEWELPEAAAGGKATALKGAGGAKAAAALKGTTAIKGTGVALQTGTTQNVAAATTTTAGTGNVAAASKGVTAQVASGSGTIWTGSGMKLGWGLGLGAWGPILLAGTLAAVGVGIYSYMKNRTLDGELEEVTS